MVMTLTGQSMIITIDCYAKTKTFSETQEWSYKYDFPIGEVCDSATNLKVNNKS